MYYDEIGTLIELWKVGWCLEEQDPNHFNQISFFCESQSLKNDYHLVLRVRNLGLKMDIVLLHEASS